MRWPAALLLTIIISSSSVASGAPLSGREYVSGLTRLEQLSRGDNLAAARAAAASLRNATYRWEGRVLSADRALLSQIADAKTLAAVHAARPRLAATVRALRSVEATADATAKPDDTLLRDLATEQTVPSMRRGGKVATVPIANQGFWEKHLPQLKAIYSWFVRQLERIYDWLMRFWPRAATEGENGTFFGLPFGVGALVLAILTLLLLLALEAWRRRSRNASLQAAESRLVSSPDIDDNPLSREANEWERYALELAASGRIREAIRAWYHAVLVAMYRTGLLHYRKGRTNWEYVSALPAHLEWRPRFTALTRSFEREWYGRERSTVEALEGCSAEARQLLAQIASRA